jgi:D-alanine-D-alanine ligase
VRIGLTYDLKAEVKPDHGGSDDALEEYDSLETIEALESVFKSNGHAVVRLGGGRTFLENVLRERVDLVFNIAEGRGTYRSREAQVPSVLEMLNIPYCGSDPQCLAVSLDKPLTKGILASYDIATPAWKVVSTVEELKKINWRDFPYPAFVKPAYEGSSKGIRFASVIENADQMVRIVGNVLADYKQPVIVEEFITGEEVTVGVLGNAQPAIIGIMRVLPRKKMDHFIYSLEVKRDWENMVEYECPAQLGERTNARISEAALKVFSVLGCRDFSRVDFRVKQDGTPYFLEINPLPGLNPKSGDLVIMSGKMGITYKSLVSSILSAAMKRYGFAS